MEPNNLYTNKNAETSNGVKKYHPLGQKTLFMFIFKRSLIFFLLLPALFAGMFLLDYIPSNSNYVDIAVNIIIGYSILLLFLLLLVFFIGWLAYFRYWIFVDDKDLKIARGLIATEQIGIPYRRIKDIKIKRSLLDQIFGVSDIVLTVLGEENDERETTVIMPSVSKEIGLEIQDFVLRKAQVEQINVLGGQRIT